MNLYDGTGNLTNTVQYDANNNPVSSSASVYSGSQLVMTLDANGTTNASFGYDPSGNLTSTMDARGISRGFGYDVNGNQTTSSFVGTNVSGSPVTVTTATIYDAAGRVTMSIDALGNTNRTVYNAMGRPDFTMDRFGNTNGFLYDARGNLIQSSYPNGTFTRTVFDANARPIYTSDRNGVTGSRTDYDALGRATNTVRLSGIQIAISGGAVPDSALAVAGTPLSTNSTVYLPGGWVASRTGADRKTTSYGYYPDGQLMSVTNALNQVMTYEYDVAGRQSVVVDALNRPTQFEYDALGRQIKTIFADNSFVTNVFNNLGQRTGVKDQAGLLTQFAYDVTGALTNVSKPQVPNPAGAGNVTPQWGYQYDAFGRLSVTTDPNSRGTTNRYDELGREVARSLAGGGTSSNVFNARGQLWRQFDFKGQWTEFAYDGFGRTKGKFVFAGAGAPEEAVCYRYNTLGQLTNITERYGVDADTNACDGYSALYPNSKFKIQNEKWEARAFAWAQREVPTEAGGAWAGAVVLALLAFGVRGVRCQVRELAVIGWERFQFEVSSFKGRERSTFNIQRSTFIAALCALCVLLRQMVFSQQPALPRRLRLPGLFWRTVSVVTLAALIYSDPNVQRLTTAQAACGNIPSNGSTETTRITNFSYDVDGRLVQVNTPEGVINYEYDQATGRHTSTCTANSRVEYGYDLLGRLATVTVKTRNGTDVNEITTYSYTKVGSRSKVKLPNGTETTYLYDNLNRLTNMTHWSSNNVALLASYTYKLHDTGRRTNAVEILRQSDVDGSGYVTNTLSWQYDGLYRLTNEVSVSSSSVLSLTNRYEYDLVGNRVKKVSGNVTTVSAYNANDHLQWEISSGGLVSTNNYVYDLNGSVVARTNNANGTTTYAYNLANKLKSVSGPGVAASYQYNDSGIRVRTLSGGVTNLFLIDANNHTGYAQVLEEFNAGATPTLTRSYVLGDDVLGQSGTTTATDPRWLLYDGHGSTRQLGGGGASVTRQYNYDAYGQSVTSLPGGTDPANTSSLLYSGEQYDSALQMYNLRARFYDPSNGRFNAMDTFRGDLEEPQSLHKYAYCHGDPVNFTDPSGNFEFTLLGLTVNITIRGIIAAAVTWAIRGAIFGGVLGGIDAALASDATLQSIIDGTLDGMKWGAIFGPLARLKIIRPLLLLFGFIAGTAGAIDSFDRDEGWQGLFRAGLAIASFAGFARSITSLLKKPQILRVPRDVERQTDYPAPPRANAGNGTIGSSAGQRDLLNLHLRIARFMRARDMRTNQEQVNAGGTRVGMNKPDLQFTLFGRRVYIEYDTMTSGRGPGHQNRILANDPEGLVLLFIRD